MDIKNKLLKKIETEHVTPIAQWQFLVRGYGLWVLSAALLILGSLGVATLLYILTKNDWDIYSELYESKFTHILSSLPYLWLFLFIFMVLLLYLDVKHTKHGYRYGSLMLILTSMIVSIALGTGLHAIGFGKHVDDLIEKTIPQHAHIFNPRLDKLSHPEKGVVMGRVKIIEPSTTTTKIYIENPRLEGTWLLIVHTTTTLPPNGIHINDRIRALGETTAETRTFQARLILPYNTMDHDWRARKPKERPRMNLPIVPHEALPAR